MLTKAQTFFSISALIATLIIVGCGESQQRIPISDRSKVSNPLLNSKLMNIKTTTNDCTPRSETGEKSKNVKERKFLSLVELQKTFSKEESGEYFARKYTANITAFEANSVYPHQNTDLQDSKLITEYLLQNGSGLNLEKGTLQSVAEGLFTNIFEETCDRIIFTTDAGKMSPYSLFFEVAGIDTSFSDVRIAAANGVENSTNIEMAAVNPSTTESIQVEYLIDKEYSNHKQLFLKAPNNNRIIIKLVSSEIVDVIVEESKAIDVCGENIDHVLRTETRIVWGDELENPLSLSQNLYKGMIAVSKNSKLLSNVAVDMKKGIAAGLNVKLPITAIESFQDSVDSFSEGEANDLDIYQPACGNE